MNTSKCFLSTLIAAAAMSVGAWAGVRDVVSDGLQWAESFGDGYTQTATFGYTNAFHVENGVGVAGGSYANSRVWTTNTGGKFTNAFTFSFELVDFDAANWTDALSLYTNGTKSGTNNSLQLQKNSNGELMVYTENFTGSNVKDDASNINLGSIDALKGKVITLSFDATGANNTLTAYVDGVKNTDIVTFTYADDVTPSTALTGFQFGAAFGGSRVSNSVTVDNIAVWNVALSQANVLKAAGKWAGLTWSATGDSATWSMDSKVWEDESKVFEAGKDVHFSTADGVAKSVNVEGEISAGNLYFDANYTLRIGEGESLSAGGITTESGVVVGLSLASGATLNISGGEATFSGSVASGATLNVSGGEATFSGSVASGAILNVSGGTLNLSGEEVTFSGSVASGATLNVFGGTTTITCSGPNGDGGLQGNLIVGSDATVIGTGGDAIPWGGSNHEQVVKVLGELELKARWSMNTNKKLVLAGGTVSGTGASHEGRNNVVLDYFNGGTISTEEGTVGSEISGNILFKDGKLGFNVASNSDLVVSGQINTYGASSGLEKTGDGKLTLSNSNGYSGGTTISGGRLVAENAGALSSGNVTNNSELEVSLSQDGTMSNVISGSGKFIKTGSGSLTLTGNNTYTGGTTISGGTLVAAHKNALGASNGTVVTVGAGASLVLNANMDGTERRYVLGGGTLVASLGTSSTQKQIASGNDAIVLTADSTIQADADFGMVSGGWGKNQLNLAEHTLTKTGAGTFFLSQTTVTQGAIYIEEGTIQCVSDGGASDASNAAITIRAGSGKLDVTTTSFKVGSLTLEVSDSYTDATLLGSGTLTVGDGQIVIKRSDATTLNLAAGTAYTYQIAASDATFDDNWTANSFELEGWSTGWYVEDYSNGQLTLAIPEPSTFGLLAGLGALTLVGTRRRRKKA